MLCFNIASENEEGDANFSTRVQHINDSIACCNIKKCHQIEMRVQMIYNPI